MSLRLLLSTLLLVALFLVQHQERELTPTSSPSEVHLPEGGTVVPLVPGRELPTVEVYVGDAGPFFFIVEWAGNVLAVSERVREQAELEVVGMSPHGNQLVAVPVLSVGDTYFEGLVADVPPFLARTNHDGALGLNVFRELVGTLDFPGGKLRLSARPLPDPEKDPSVVAYSPGPGGSPRIPIELGGRPFQAVLDTAAQSTLIVDERYLAELELAGELRAGPLIMTPAMGRLQTQVGRIAGELVIGSARTKEPLTMFHRMQEKEILLGGGFLRDYALTLDQANHRLRLARPSDKE